ncbi:MAG: GNVR domain-containing protein [Pseudomonadota bacterium]
MDMKKNEFEEINIKQYIDIILKYKKQLAIFVFSVIILSSIISLVLTKKYISNALISTSFSDSSLGGQYSSLLGGIAGNFMKLKEGGGNQRIIGLIKSRTMLDDLIKHFKLIKEFEIENIDSARYKLNKIFEVEENDSGFVKIEIEYKDPILATNIINYCRDKLDRINIGHSIFGASKERVFLGNRLLEVKNKLFNAEETLKEFQIKNKVIGIENQISSSVAVITNLHNDLAQAETQFGVKSKFKSADDEEIVTLKYTINEIKKQIKEISTGENINGEYKNNTKDTGLQKVKHDNSSYLLPLDESPQLGLEFLRLKREFEIQETIFELLTEQYELAKIKELKNLPTITIVDRAVKPSVKSSPRRKLIVMVSTFMAIFLSIIFVFSLEFIKSYYNEYKRV